MPVTNASVYGVVLGDQSADLAELCRLVVAEQRRLDPRDRTDLVCALDHGVLAHRSVEAGQYTYVSDESMELVALETSHALLLTTLLLQNVFLDIARQRNADRVVSVLPVVRGERSCRTCAVQNRDVIARPFAAGTSR